MNTRLLFPHRFRLIGWLILVPMVVLGTATMYWDFQWDWLDIPLPKWLSATPNKAGGINFDNLGALGSSINLTNELAALGSIGGLLIVAFSKEKVEDEMIVQLRLEALQWSIYANYVVLGVGILLVYGLAFYTVTVYNMFTVLLVFIARFRWLVYKNNQLLAA